MRNLIDLVQSLFEAPIGNIDYHGAMTPASLRADDIGIVNSLKWRVKVKRVLEKAPVMINLVFLNHERQYQGGWDEIGDPNRRLVATRHMGQSDRASGIMATGEVERIYGVDIPADPHALTAVFAFNEGDERWPFTPWMIAHRLAHLVEEAYGRRGGGLRPLLVDIQDKWRDLGYDVVKTASIEHLIQDIGTTKAARDGKLNNLGEFINECFAQYLVTGNIRLNPVTENMIAKASPNTRRLYPKLAKMIDDHPAAHIPNPDAVNTMLATWKETAKATFKSELDKLVGWVVVM
jgi:hypothetical protein